MKARVFLPVIFCLTPALAQAGTKRAVHPTYCEYHLEVGDQTILSYLDPEENHELERALAQAEKSLQFESSWFGKYEEVAPESTLPRYFALLRTYRRSELSPLIRLSLLESIVEIEQSVHGIMSDNEKDAEYQHDPNFRLLMQDRTLLNRLRLSVIGALPEGYSSVALSLLREGLKNWLAEQDPEGPRVELSKGVAKAMGLLRYLGEAEDLKMIDKLIPHMEHWSRHLLHEIKARIEARESLEAGEGEDKIVLVDDRLQSHFDIPEVQDLPLLDGESFFRNASPLPYYLTNLIKKHPHDKETDDLAMSRDLQREFFKRSEMAYAEYISREETFAGVTWLLEEGLPLSALTLYLSTPYNADTYVQEHWKHWQPRFTQVLLNRVPDLNVSELRLYANLLDGSEDPLAVELMNAFLQRKDLPANLREIIEETRDLPQPPPSDEWHDSGDDDED